MAKPFHLASFLKERAQSEPFAKAVIFPEGKDSSGRTAYTHLTNSQLYEYTETLVRQLCAIGIHKGQRICLLVTPSLDFFPLTFALFKIGAIPVFIDPAIGRKYMKACLREADPTGFIGSPKAQVARFILGWGHKRFSHIITVGGRFGFGGKHLKDLLASPTREFSLPEEPQLQDGAAILFTSGSTGTPKGAHYTHGNFIGQIEALKNTFHIRPGEKDLCTFPLFALFAPALGMTAVIPKMDFTKPGSVDPDNILGPIRDFGITNLFGSPALLRRLIPKIQGEGLKLPSLNRIVSAGAPVPYQTLQALLPALRKDADIFTPYGATESLPVACMNARAILAETAALTKEGGGICVGHPVDHLAAKIIKITDTPIATLADCTELPNGDIGEIIVSGPQVTTSYFNNKKANTQGKIIDGNTTWHRMGDAGYRDNEGRLWFCGRKNHRVTSSNGDIYTIPTESIFNEHNSVDRTALVGAGEKGKETPVLWVETKNPTEELRQSLLTLSRNNPKTKPVEKIMFHQGFPVDIRHNAKIYREQLKIQAEERL